MNARQRLAEYLQTHGVEFTVHTHPEAYTAQEVAAAEHVPGQKFAKVVMAKADGELVMLCMPAPYEVDFDAAGRALGADEVRLATEEEFAPVFEDCDLGAMPPFGNLYEVPVYVDETLTRDDRIVFNAGSHTETMEVRYEDFERLVTPKVLNFARHV